MCWTSVIRRVRPKLHRHSGQNPPATHSAQGSSPFLPLPTASQHDATLRLVTLDQRTTRIGRRPGSSKETNLESWRTTDASTQESSNNATSFTSWWGFACSPPPPPRPQISHTILTQAEWCAIRAVARSELGPLSPRDIKTAETGARVYWH